MRSFKHAVLILLFPIFAACVAPAPAAIQASPPVAASPQIKLICETVTPPDEPGPNKSCDELCAAKEATCVWNSALINPTSCEGPTYGHACRCCHLGE